MIPEPLPPLLRGLGTLLILLTSALVVTVERRDNAERAEQAHLARIALKAERSLQQGRADTDALAIERSPQAEKPGWAARFRAMMKARKEKKD